MKKGQPNPFMGGQSTAFNIGDAGRKSEKRLAVHVGARLTPASGAVDGHKSDMYTPEYRLEAKSTQNASMSIKLEWLVKITEEALNTNKVPALTVSFTDGVGRPRRFGDWVMIPLSHYEEIKSIYEQRGET